MIESGRAGKSASAGPGGTPSGLASLTPTERAKRFWTAHGRSADDLIVLYAFACNPAVAWSPERLCMWYGIRIDRAHRIVDELVRCGVVRPAHRGAYRWNDAHDWAVPRTPVTRRVVQERWASLAGCTDRAPTLVPSAAGPGT